MEQSDYLKRQFDQLGRVLAKLLSDLTGQKSKETITALRETAHNHLKGESGFDLEEIFNLHTGDLIHYLVKEKEWNNENLEKLADILLIFADNTEEQQSKPLYEKTLTIYEYLEKSENIYSLENQWKIKKIKDVL